MTYGVVPVMAAVDEKKAKPMVPAVAESPVVSPPRPAGLIPAWETVRFERG
jgi:hypothetical protein